MDRLETEKKASNYIFNVTFIFQYGQIRNSRRKYKKYTIMYIYIPVWIDQKLIFKNSCYVLQRHLYSSMDRLETLTKYIK